MKTSRFALTALALAASSALASRRHDSDPTIRGICMIEGADSSGAGGGNPAAGTATVKTDTGDGINTDNPAPGADTAAGGDKVLEEAAAGGTPPEGGAVVEEGGAAPGAVVEEGAAAGGDKAADSAAGAGTPEGGTKEGGDDTTT